MTRTLIVDGTKEIIANGVSLRAHAISNATDYTYQRIVGYAVTLEDAALWAAAGEIRDAAVSLLPHMRWATDCDPAINEQMERDVERLRAVILKSEVR